MIDYHVLFEASPNAYVLLSPDFTLVEANAAYLAATGRRREDILGRNMFSAFPDPDENNRRALLSSLRKVLTTGQRDSLALIPYSIPREGENGPVFEQRYWSATHIPLLDQHGQVAWILQHTVDVTELQMLKSAMQGGEGTSHSQPQVQLEHGVFHRAQEVQSTNRRLDAETRQLRKLFEQAPGFVCYLSGPHHVFELVNRAFVQMVGDRPLLGRTLEEALPEIRGQGFIEILREVYNHGRAYVGRGRRSLLQRSPGAELSEVYLDMVFQPVVEEDGSVSGIFVQGHDITEQKRYEHELQDYRDTLEDQVRERTLQLSELNGYLHKIGEAEKLRLSRELHDELGSLLMGIMMDVQRAHEQVPPGETLLRERLQRALGRLAEGIDMKRRIIEDLRPTVLFHLGLTDALLSLVNEVAERQGWEVDLRLPAECRVFSEETALALYRSAQECLSNCVRHAQARQVGLSLECEDGSVVLSVWDDGRGFDTGGRREHTDVHHGLRSIEQRALALGGHVELQTAPGQGTRVSVHLPDPVRDDEDNLIPI